MQPIDNNIINSISKASRYSGVKRIGVCGSYARGEQTPSSDIDILFDYYYKDDDDNGIDDALRYLDDLEGELRRYLGEIRIDFISYTGVIESSNEKVRKNILNDVIWVYSREQATQS